jgi:hypothetical protein
MDMARQGMALKVKEKKGMAWHGRHGMERKGMAWQGKAWTWHDMERQGMAWKGKEMH